MKGLLLMVCAEFCFSSVALLVKLSLLPVSLILLSRSCIVAVLCLIVLGFHGILSKPFSNRTKLLMILKGIFGLASTWAVYFSLEQLPLADAVTLQFLAPGFVILLAACILKEPFKLLNIVHATISLVGVLLVTQPETLFRKESLSRLVPTVVAVGGSFAAACSFVCVTAITEPVSSFLVLLYHECIMLFASAVFLWLRRQGLKHLLVSSRMLSIALIGPIVFIAQYCLISSLREGPASQVTSVKYVQIIFAFFWQAALLRQEKFELWSSIGSFLVVFSVSFKFLHDYWTLKRDGNKAALLSSGHSTESSESLQDSDSA